MDRMARNVSGTGPPARQGGAMQNAYETLCEIQSATSRRLKAHLSDAGFSDIPDEGLPILAAIYAGRTEARVLIGRLGMTRQAVTQLVETLMRRGYLDFRENRNDSRQPIVVLAERGRGAMREAIKGTQQDRWAEFTRRPGDIIISTTPKSGTTWVQTMCALLIFQTPDLPASLPELSPWLDGHRQHTRAEIYAELAAQQHRRFIKTHLPLNEIPDDQRITYITVGRNPLDIAVSYHYQASNLMAVPERRDGKERPVETTRQWVLDRIGEMGKLPHGQPSYIDTILRDLSSAWERRADPNVVLVHYEDLSADLPGEMRRLAGRLGISVPEDKWPSLAQAATFTHMRAAADRLQPMRNESARDTSKGYEEFFRRGSSGDGRALLTEAEADRYYARAAQAAPQELLAWLHRDVEW